MVIILTQVYDYVKLKRNMNVKKTVLIIKLR
nr:MAG TPA: hypothetical protein [Inoviridae sp.]